MPGIRQIKLFALKLAYSFEKYVCLQAENDDFVLKIS
jgi:hypothetical protein